MRTMLCAVALGFGLLLVAPVATEKVAPKPITQVISPEAQAHFIPYAAATKRWYAINQDRCGAGSYWYCYVELSVKCPYALGNHSWHCDFRFREAHGPPAFKLRTCEIRGQLEHYDLVYRERVCW